MKFIDTTRRDFLLRMGGAAGAAWLNAQWPAAIAAAQHARAAAQTKKTVEFEALTAEQAREVDALSSRIIPSGDTPGAREAGVVYFIDRALKTFASDTRSVYEKGITDINSLTGEMFPGVERFSAATTEQQDQILTELAKTQDATTRRRSRGGANVPTDFFQLLTFHTTFGFLVDPEGGGNRDYVGWKVIGRDPSPTFAPPFGYYDKDYPGWEAASAPAEKKTE